MCVHLSISKESCQIILIELWPNGLASRRKLKNWVYLGLLLARPCGHLR